MKIVPLVQILSFRILFFVLGSALSGAVASAAAAEQAPEHYAVMSLIGDEISIVHYRPTVRSNLDVNPKQTVAMPDDSFDRAAIVAAEGAIKRAVPAAATTLLLVSDKTLYARQQELFESEDASRALVAMLGALLKDNGTRYLVLITKHRAEARMKFDRARIGSGKISGLGFYLDYQLRTTRNDTGESGAGFVAPFAYLAVSLVDLQTGAVIRTRSATESHALSSARSTTSADPWDALTPEQKVRILRDLARLAIDEVMPQVVAPG